MPRSSPIGAEPADVRSARAPTDDHAGGGRGTRRHLLRRLLTASAVLCLAAVSVWALGRHAAQINFQLFIAALRAIPPATLADALAATALSYIALAGYDLCGLRYAQAGASLKTVLIASFCGFAIGNSIGLGAFSGAAVRYRIYTAAGLSPNQIARVNLFIVLAFTTGLVAVAAFALAFQVDELGHLLRIRPTPLRLLAAFVFSLAIGWILILCALRRLIGRCDMKILASQAGFTSIHLFAAAAALWMLLPQMKISLPAFLAIYATARGLGALSRIPAGLGVFDSVVLYVLSSSASASAVAAALVAYRGLHFLLPLLVSTILLADLERKHSPETGQRIGRVATELAPLFLAATTFAVGAILVVQGAMPAFVDRLQILRVAAPLWAIEASHFLTSVAGLLLLFAARGLYLRLDGAWWLASAMTLLSIPFSLIKGLAIVAPSVSIALLIALLGARRQFPRKASLLSQPLSVSWLFAAGCVMASMVWILLFAFSDVEYAHELWWQFEFDAAAPRALRTVLGICLFGLALGISQLLRPATAHPAPPTAEEIERARRIAIGQSRPEALLALMGDKRFLFSDSGLAFLMFATSGRTWAALGDPIGPPAERQGLVWRFIELALNNGGRAAFYQIPAASLPLYLDAGLKILKLGEEARLFLPSFTLEGSARAELRYVLHRGERDGLEFGLISHESTHIVMDEMAAVSSAWLSRHGRQGEKRFSVAAFSRDYIQAQPVALLRQNGELVAFATVMATALKDEVTVGLMRHKPDRASRYAMEYLFIRLIGNFREQGYRNFSLGMVPLSGLLSHPLAPRWHRLGRAIWSLGRRFYNFQGLRTFKGKFHPTWEPRYLAASGWLGPYLALIDIAALVSGMRIGLGRHHMLGGSDSNLAGLPLIELPARPRGPLLAIIFSGDGGWRRLERTIGKTLQSAGVSVVGWDSLRYFWRMKSPERTARDLGAVIETFVARWDSSKIALVGYSFGAGVLPFTYNLLPAATRERVVQLSLLGLAGAANFEIRISGWFGAAPGKDARPIRTALDAIDPGLVQCIYGADDVHSACRSLLGTSEVIRTAGGHHFDGDYGTLALRILDGLHRRAESAVASGHQSGA